MTTGGGSPSSTHVARTKVSPACQGLLDGTRDFCDLGAHEWHFVVGREESRDLARCARCERTEPVAPRR